ncbi:hypothetical protein EST38_g9819 [Candolleomyces aberdarensis]|uniref:Uncharacterized protein n=1 Tax=Candolleomyces aberdarensis TaxID=2316362 RepID=A0A4Q2DC90_9AGAR|nr:hypothetical protein EST38_g9819 [Candolleomyces aberdarensis]
MSSILNDARHFTVGGDVISNHYDISSPKSSIEKLREHIAAGALHNSAERCDAPKCHKETRVAVQDEVVSWIRRGDCDGVPKKIMWVTGPAGAGKTAVMGSVADTCQRKGILAATHFFSSFSGSANRRSKKYLVPTLAYQLVQHKALPQVAEQILLAVEHNPAVFDQMLEVQLDELILAPLRACRDHSQPPEWPTAILIDGLDECEADQYHDTARSNAPLRSKEDDQTEILSVLKKAAKDPAFPFRIVIASRPEHAIKHFFTDVANSMARELFLDEKYNPDADMALFLASKFAKIRRRYHLPSSWPGKHVSRALINNASGQFIYVATIVRFIEGEGHPDQRLKQLLQLPGIKPSTNPFAPLDALYSHIFNSDPNPHPKLLWLNVLFRDKLLERAVSIDRETGRPQNGSPSNSWEWAPPVTAVIARLFLESYPGEESYVFENLNSLVRAPSRDSGRYALYHKSLVDFLADRSRSGELYIESAMVLDFFVDRYMELWKNKGPESPPTVLEQSDFFSLFFSSTTIGTIFTGEENVSRLEKSILSCDIACTFRPTNVLKSVPHRYANAPDGKKAIQAHYPKGSYTFGHKPQGGFSFYAPGPLNLENAKEATFGYSVFFPQGFNFQLGGKLPGLYGGNSDAEAVGCSGGRRDDGCFSARLMWRSQGKGEFYTYFPPSASANQKLCNVPPSSHCNPTYGASVGTGSFTFATGRWTTVAERVKLNDAGKANGEIELFVNGKSVINVSGLVLRTSDAGKFRGMQMQTFFGGSKPEFASPKDQNVFFSDFSVAVIENF